MEKIITISVLKNGAIKYDLGKKEKPIFMLIEILCSCIRDMAHSGYKKEIENYEREIKKYNRKKKK